MWLTAGHESAREALARSLSEGRTSHAYLFTGPSSIGKRRLALDFAKALNCNGDAIPCGECRSCKRIEAWQHPDVVLVSVGGVCDESDHDHQRDGSKDIKICQVRNLQRAIALQPFEGRMRVVVIDPAERLNTFAADAMLKTMEEPPAQVTILLLSDQASSLSETVVSRARTVSMQPVPIATISATLSDRGVEAQQADLIARLSAGRIGWALTYSADPSQIEERSRRLDRIEDLLGAGRTARMAFAAELAVEFASDREGTYGWLDLWRGWLRDLLLVAEGCDDLVTNSDRVATFRQRADRFTVAGLVLAIDALRECRQHLDDNVNARLALEAFALRLPSQAVREEAGR
jgi:DNA polymerase III subunit delta'